MTQPRPAAFQMLLPFVCLCLQFGQMVMPLQNVLDFLFELLERREEEDKDWSVEQVMKVLRNATQVWKGPTLPALPSAASFRYEETDSPDEFFLPCVRPAPLLPLLPITPR